VAGTAALPTQLIADTSGAHPGERPGEVVLDGGDDTVALLLTRSPFVTVDGFLITGAQPRENPPQSATAVHVRSGSANFTISHCIIANAAAADGIRIQASSDALIFNNLIFANDRGISITGDSARVRVINNTIANHERTGIVLQDNAGVAPTGATLLNNIIQGNGNGLAITVDEGPPSSAVGYDGDFNLVFEPEATDQNASYRPASIRGDRDVNADAQFINVEQGDVRLDPASPAVDAGSGGIDPALLSALFERTTAEDAARDRMPVDMGYHYPR
jgi:parallel beta-helix repeat protein